MPKLIYVPVNMKPPAADPVAEEEAAPEWQYDKWGKKYRKIGSMIEYAPTITVDGIEVYQDELEEHNRRNKERMKELREEENRQTQQKATAKHCPLDRYASFAKQCQKDCALYRPTGCAMSKQKAHADTLGKYCPFMRQCTKDCALYDQGCTI